MPGLRPDEDGCDVSSADVEDVPTVVSAACFVSIAIDEQALIFVDAMATSYALWCEAFIEPEEAVLLEPWCEARDSKARNTAVEPTAAHIAAARFREAAPPTQCAIASSNASCATTDARAAAVVAPAKVASSAASDMRASAASAEAARCCRTASRQRC